MNCSFAPDLNAFEAGRAFQNNLCIEKLQQLAKLLYALNEIATIKERIPWDAAEAATECIRIAKEALKS